MLPDIIEYQKIALGLFWNILYCSIFDDCQTATLTFYQFYRLTEKIERAFISSAF